MRIGMLAKLRLIVPIFLCVLLILGMRNVSYAASNDWAIVSNFNGTISILDPATNTAYGPFLGGILPAGILYEVKVTPDGKTALIAAFFSTQVHFIDLSNPTSPTYLGSVGIPHYVENLAISPNGKCAVVGDGSAGNPNVFIIDIPTRTYLGPFYVPNTTELTDVAISSDGVNVLVSDFHYGRVHLLTLNQSTCSLTPVTFFSVPTPENAEFSPDGGTALVASFNNGSVATFRVNGPGSMTQTGTLSNLCSQPHSIAFSGLGKAYVDCSGYSPDRLAVLNVNAPGNVTDSGTRITLSGNASSGYYGVNQMTVTGDNRYAIVSHMNANNFVSVVDLSTNTLLGTMPTGNSMSVAAMSGTSPATTIVKRKANPPSMLPAAQNNILKGKDLLVQAEGLLTQAQAKNLDTAVCEKFIDEAKADLAEAKLRLTSPTTANYFALKAAKKLQAALDCLKALMG